MRFISEPGLLSILASLRGGPGAWAFCRLSSIVRRKGKMICKRVKGDWIMSARDAFAIRPA